MKYVLIVVLVSLSFLMHAQSNSLHDINLKKSKTYFIGICSNANRTTLRDSLGDFIPNLKRPLFEEIHLQV